MDGILIIGIWTLLRLIVPFGLLLLLGTLMERHNSSTTSW